MRVLIDDKLRRRLIYAVNHAPQRTPEGKLDDLRRVGPDKPLGYLSISTITDICHTTPEALQEELRGRGLRAEQKRGMLYVWDEGALNALIQANQETLSKIHWSKINTSEEFVHFVVISEVPQRKIFGRQKNLGPLDVAPRTELYDVIADAFGDHTNPGRKYIEETHIPDSPPNIMDKLRKAGLPHVEHIIHNVGEIAHDLIIKCQRQAAEKNNQRNKQSDPRQNDR